MKFLSKKQVSEKIGLSRTEIDRKEGAGKFPRRVQVGFRVFWVNRNCQPDEYGLRGRVTELVDLSAVA